MGELVDTKFRIFDCPICISEERAAYNRIRLDFIKLANEAAEQYANFLRTRDGQKILFLELGVEFNTPVIIKYPFWQITAKNSDAVYFIDISPVNGYNRNP